MSTVRYYFPKECYEALAKLPQDASHTDHLSDEELKKVVRFNLSEQLFSGMPISRALLNAINERKLKLENILH